MHLAGALEDIMPPLNISTATASRYGLLILLDRAWVRFPVLSGNIEHLHFFSSSLVSIDESLIFPCLLKLLFEGGLAIIGRQHALLSCLNL